MDVTETSATLFVIGFAENLQCAIKLVYYQA